MTTVKEELRQDEYNSFINDLAERLYKIGTNSFLEQGDLGDFDADFSLNDARELITESPLQVIDILMDMLANLEIDRALCDEYQNTDAPYFALSGVPWDV